MALFAYIALDATGRQLTGTIPADNRAEAMDHVISRGLSPIEVNEEKTAAAMVKVSTSTRVSQSAVESYPCVLAVFAAAVLTFLLTFFIPKFQGVFAEFGGKLPTLTLLVVAASNTMIHYGWAVALLLIGAVIVIKRAMGTDSGRRAFERM